MKKSIEALLTKILQAHAFKLFVETISTVDIRTIMTVANLKQYDINKDLGFEIILI